MRILTGDECGILKEIIPELIVSSSRQTTNTSSSSLSSNRKYHGSDERRSSNNNNNVQFQQQFQQKQGMMGGIQRLGHDVVNPADNDELLLSGEDSNSKYSSSSSIPGREGGIVSLAFIPSNGHHVNDDEEEDDDDSTFQFAALRMNGIVEIWKGNRQTTDNYNGGTHKSSRRGDSSSGGGGSGRRRSSSSSIHDERERNVTPCVYTQCNVSTTSVLPQSSYGGGGDDDDDNGDEKEEEEEEVLLNDKKNQHNTTTGWYMEQPIRPIGMVALPSSSSSSSTSSSGTKPLLATCDSIGTISLLSAHEGIGNCEILARYNAFGLSTSNYYTAATNNNNNKSHSSDTTTTAVVLPHPSSSKNPSNTSIGTTTLTYTKGRYANTHMATCFAVDTTGTKFAVGGRERSVVVLDVEYGNVIWKAKNLPPDPQTLLQQPMWTTALQFLHTPTTTTSPTSSSSSSAWFSNIGGSNGGNGNCTTLLATGTAYKQVQIYDIRCSSSSSSSTALRRPVLYTPEHLLEHRITTLCQLQDGYTLAVGDTVGDVHLLDMRKMHSGKQQQQYNNKIGGGGGGGGNGRRMGSSNTAKEEIGKGRLVGPGGSIRQLYRHPTIPHYLGCVGYDRKLWMWNVQSRKMVECVYLKQRLNCLLICDDGRSSSSWNGDEKDEEEKDLDRSHGRSTRGAEYEGDTEEEEEEERNLEEVDEVEDYVDSDDTDESKETESEEELESDTRLEDGGGNSSSDSGEEEDGDNEEEDDGDKEEEEEEEEEEERMKKSSGKQPTRKRLRM